MIDRFVTMFALLAIAVVTTMTPAHTVRMSAGQDHVFHVSEMMHVTDDSGRSCADQLHCGTADASICGFVCAGFTAFLPFPSAKTGQEYVPSRHDFPLEASHVGHAPGLNERPPKFRLL
ncbi:hypothetical protein [Stappia sp. 28M-7]|uniref:hypothetical protein n=1 Tax=Stappia sp. 28M-7 TaxID=2762596 RepID=UPI00163C4D5F|nr:hypothetical protein [Stappia sp. 28M-7]MBC2858467.1 hypothetical protein [Stappia sp. 28M-7]